MKNILTSILFSIIVLPFLILPGNISNQSYSPLNLDTFKKDSSEVLGIDVSVHQNQIIWKKIEDIDFVFIKASEGVTIQDKMFFQNWDSAKIYGVIRGAYHFYRPYVTPQEQFKNFINLVNIESGDLPPVLDAEVPSRNKKKLIEDYKIWLNLVENYYQITPIIYCNWAFYKSHFTDEYFRKYNFWIANYVTEDICSLTEDWHFWQHTCYGKIPGISGYVDRNKFNGSYVDLLSLCKK